MQHNSQFSTFEFNNFIIALVLLHFVIGLKILCHSINQ